MNIEDATASGRIQVNQDGQIVITPGNITTRVCAHIMQPSVLSRELSLAVAKAVIAAQEGPEVKR